MLRIAPARTAGELTAVRELLLEYQAQLDVDLGPQGFDAELRNLTGAYGPPGGLLLLAAYDGWPAGCVALHALDAGRAEMKRLYVRPRARGLGIGQALVAELIAAARASGYVELVLDTLPSMQSAQRLYARFGFQDIPAYAVSPYPGTRYLGLQLGPATLPPTGPTGE
jgi:putative acetyltransferase